MPLLGWLLVKTGFFCGLQGAPIGKHLEGCARFVSLEQENVTTMNFITAVPHLQQSVTKFLCISGAQVHEAIALAHLFTSCCLETFAHV